MNDESNILKYLKTITIELDEWMETANMIKKQHYIDTVDDHKDPTSDDLGDIDKLIKTIGIIRRLDENLSEIRDRALNYVNDFEGGGTYNHIIHSLSPYIDEQYVQLVEGIKVDDKYGVIIYGVDPNALVDEPIDIGLIDFIVQRSKAAGIKALSGIYLSDSFVVDDEMNWRKQGHSKFSALSDNDYTHDGIHDMAIHRVGITKLGSQNKIG